MSTCFRSRSSRKSHCKLKAILTTQIIALIENGVTTFLSGMALAADTWCAEIVLASKEYYPNVPLIAALPCETQADRWSVEQRDRHFNILERCDEVVYVSRQYSSGCMFKVFTGVKASARLRLYKRKPCLPN
ncbi:MAG: SLOG family protein [Clostridiaceae bacterium]|nr:SLOG family protein [Clostridiaceae bacterium]